MKFLVVAQDLKVSGTSEGIVSRSFLAKLRKTYPNAIIDVLYLKKYESEDQLDLLPVDSIETHILNLKIPFLIQLINKLYWRIFHVSLSVNYVYKVYRNYISKADFQKYDHVFIRSAGLFHETILGAKDLPILKKAIVNFHDPYPIFWYVGSQKELTSMEMYKMKEMQKVVTQAKTCMSSANCMSNDMEYLYGSRKKFYTLPHQYAENVFDLSDVSSVLKKNKKITISYHGAIQFGRNIEILLDAYQDLVETNPVYKDNTEFALRMKGIDLKKLAAKYSKTPNIKILGTLNFSNSCYEQQHIADINIILENGPVYCNILVGKAPFLAALEKPVLSLSPKRSELRNIIKDERYIATSSDKTEIKNKLENLIISRLKSDEPVFPFGDYFSDEKFKNTLEEILKN
jgi:glycosyltransferase involved in cell wall biosynthesis